MGTSDYNEETWPGYAQRDPTDVTRQFIAKGNYETIIRDVEEKRSIIHMMDRVPNCLLKRWVKGRIAKELDNKLIKSMAYYSPEEI